MKILRLFVSYNLDNPINWIIVNEDGSAGDSGFSTFRELIDIPDVQVEVYLSTTCCSVFRLNVAGISNKRLTEELVLGMLEDRLVDDIDMSHAVILKNDDIAYVAVFNREFYDKLLEQLSLLDKTILFIQSIAYATVYENKSLTVFLDNEQSFIRTGQYEYYMLDDNLPLPTLLEDILLDTPPEKIYLYANDANTVNLIQTKFNIPCQLMRNDELVFGELLWNFYNQKSTRFKLKLSAVTLKSIKSILNKLKWFSILMVIAWLFMVVFLNISNFKLNREITKDLKAIVPSTSSNKNIMSTAEYKIAQMYHTRGIYSNTDAVPMMQIFFEVMSTIGTNSITEIKYNKNQLEVFLNDNFSPTQFVSYENIFLVKQITANILEYKAYAKKYKTQDNNNHSSQFSGDTNNMGSDIQQMPVTDENTKWVIQLTLRKNGNEK